MREVLMSLGKTVAGDGRRHAATRRRRRIFIEAASIRQWINPEERGPSISKTSTT